MAYALFDYFETEQLDVGKVADIKWNQGEELDLASVIKNDLVVRVAWAGPGRTKKSARKPASDFPARIVKISDDESLLRNLAKDIEAGKRTLLEVKSMGDDGPSSEQGRGKRTKFSHQMTDSEQSETCDDVQETPRKRAKKDKMKTKKDSSLDILSRLKDREKATERSGSLLADNVKLTKENVQLKKENVQLRHALTAIAYLPKLVTTIRNLSSPSAASEVQLVSDVSDDVLGTSAILSTPKQFQPSTASATSAYPASTPVIRDASGPTSSSSASNTSRTASPTQPNICKDFDITAQLLSACCTDSTQKFVNDLLSGLYSDEYLATHHLGGKSSKPSSKEGIPSQELSKIISAVRQKCNVDESEARRCVRQKLNNADKTFLAKGKKSKTSAVGGVKPDHPDHADESGVE